jgi:hypothetical protein
MPKPPPPLRPLAVSVVLGELRVLIPVTALAILAIALTPGLALLLQPSLQRHGEAPSEQAWTAGTTSVASLAWTSVRGALPPPDPRQRKPPCALDMGEEESGGVCWIRLDVEPPCPQGKAWERGGKCYARVLEVKALPREPTSGEGRTLGIADH